MKSRYSLSELEHSQNMHRMALAYASDMLISHAIFMSISDIEPSLVTSLDHTIWFHENVDFNQWHLFVQECVHSTQGKPLNIAR